MGSALDGVGKPATSQRLINGAVERRQTYSYDSLSRPIQTDTTQQIAAGTTKAYTQTVAYDGNYGRPKSTAYPNFEAVATYYSKYGIPIRSFNPATGAIYREITAVDLTGLPTVATLGGRCRCRPSHRHEGRAPRVRLTRMKVS